MHILYWSKSPKKCSVRIVLCTPSSYSIKTKSEIKVALLISTGCIGGAYKLRWSEKFKEYRSVRGVVQEYTVILLPDQRDFDGFPPFTQWGSFPWPLEFELDPVARSAAGVSSPGGPQVSGRFVPLRMHNRMKMLQNTLRIQLACLTFQIGVLIVCAALAMAHWLDKEISRMPVSFKSVESWCIQACFQSISQYFLSFSICSFRLHTLLSCSYASFAVLVRPLAGVCSWFLHGLQAR